MSSYRAKKLFGLIAYDLSGITQSQKRHKSYSLTQERVRLKDIPFICCNIEQYQFIADRNGINQYTDYPT